MMSRDRGRCQQCSSIRTQGNKRVLRASRKQGKEGSVTKSLNKLAAVSALHETLEELAGDGAIRHHLPRPLHQTPLFSA
jgi:hypothetical protein